MFQAGDRHCGCTGRAPLPAKRIALDRLCGAHGVRALLETKYIAGDRHHVLVTTSHIIHREATATHLVFGKVASNSEELRYLAQK